MLSEVKFIKEDQLENLKRLLNKFGVFKAKDLPNLSLLHIQELANCLKHAQEVTFINMLKHK
jgi:hypothetical protein